MAKLQDPTVGVSTFSLAMGHKIAKLLCYHEGPPYNIPDILDAELSEVREVLDGLRVRSCWCELSPTPASPDHTVECDRARTLYERLAVK